MHLRHPSPSSPTLPLTHCYVPPFTPLPPLYVQVERLCITSYETLRKHSQALAGAFDLVVCDEGHRWGSLWDEVSYKWSKSVG